MTPTRSVPISAIRASPRNPRQLLDGIEALAESLRIHGLMQPILVRRYGGDRYEVIAGHRRLEAAKTLGWDEIDVIVRSATDEEAETLALVENLQRENLSPLEEALAFEVLGRERGWTNRKIAQMVGRSHVHVALRVRVFNDPVLAPLVLSGAMKVTTAQEFLRLPDRLVRDRLIGEAVTGKWTSTDVRRANDAMRGRSIAAHCTTCTCPNRRPATPEHAPT